MNQYTAHGTFVLPTECKPGVEPLTSRVYITDKDVRRLLPEQADYAVDIMTSVGYIEGAQTKSDAFSLCRMFTQKEPTFRAAFRRARARSIHTQKLRASDAASSLGRKSLLSWAKLVGIRLCSPGENPFKNTAFE